MSIQDTIHAEAVATISRLQAKHPDLKKTLREAHGFAVFPAMGRASVVLGGAYGRGEVFERGKPIGIASLGQMTIGVQVGGQTYSELIIFPKKPDLDRFRHGKAAFAANASAVLVKAAGSGTNNPDGVVAHAYSRGGMLLELSLGGQKFSLMSPEKLKRAEERLKKKQEKLARRAKSKAGKKAREALSGKALARAGEEAPEDQPEAEAEAEGEQEEPRAPRLLEAGARAGGTLREHPVAGTVLGMGLTGLGLAAKALMSHRLQEAASLPRHHAR